MFWPAVSHVIILMDFVPLHRCEGSVLADHESVVTETARLLNSEWPRSETARIHSLSSDCGDDLPCSLVLLENVSEHDKRVIGHSRLSPVLGKRTAVIIESVIVVKDKRGCGLGRKIMDLSESYALQLGYTTFHLSTHDKCKFYEHLGYVYSSPVSPARLNARLLNHEQVSALQAHFGENVIQLPSTKQSNIKHGTASGGIEQQPTANHVNKNIMDENGKESHQKTKPVRENEGPHSNCALENVCKNDFESNQTAASDDCTKVVSCLSNSPSPPPPPPPQMNRTTQETTKGSIFWMMKEL